MNYDHHYHAGNFADVVKHVILSTLLISLKKKDTPFCYIDTHAGAGFYDLFSDLAKKSKEYVSGIEKVIQQDNPPAIVKDYLAAVHHISNELTHTKLASLRFYPGSPLLARHLLRPHDSIIACELQPKTYEALREAFAGDKQVAIHHTDGFVGLKAFLPPKERRGVILIDPPYENLDEFTRIAHSLPMALKRFETGIYAIWYPLKGQQEVERFYRMLKQHIDHPMLAIELSIYPDLPQHLNGCGLVVINPPYQFDTSVQELLPWLWKALSINGQGTHRTFLLK